MILSCALAGRYHAAEPPAPYGPVPSSGQLAWHQLEFYGFLHFTVNTFTDKEWGYGDESPELFNPTAFDAEQIVGTAAAAGMRALILTCKHHDGFCLWPSAYTEHSVKSSPWMDGKGDVVGAISDACRRHGLKFGVYLSPWDRNHPDYGTPAYIEYYRRQLRELLGNYGPISEVWFDGANGGDGYYGGARERRNIDRRTYYDWPNTWAIVRELQPEACMFSDGGPDIRWVGNERGIAGDPCWATLNRDDFAPGIAERGRLNHGDRPGTHWVPAECDVSIRPGWFYHAHEDDRVRSPDNLMNLYYASVGRGANFLLNLPPDRRGRIHETDVASLLEFKRRLDATFGTDLATGARAEASNVRGNDPAFGADHVIDGKRDTFWCTDNAVTTPALILHLPRLTTFNVVSIREHLPLGQRVETWALDRWQDNAWVEFAQGTAIGNRRLWRGAYQQTDRVRLRITKSPVCPAITEFALYAEPVKLTKPAISRDRQGHVSLTVEHPGAVLRYTVDGAVPDPASPRYQAPFALPLGGTVKARAFAGDQGGETASRTFGMAKGDWRVVSVSAFSERGGEAERAIDDDPRTLWNTHMRTHELPPPQEIVIDLGREVGIRGFTCLPRQDGIPNGIVDRYAYDLSADGTTWQENVAAGEFSNIRANPVEQTVLLDATVRARYFRFRALRVIHSKHIAVAELGVLAAGDL